MQGFQEQSRASSEDAKMQVLADAYRQAMDRITGQKPRWKNPAMDVLGWITCAERPLTTVELQHALAVEAGEPKFDGENLPQTEAMISVCAGLVTVDEESDIIRLVHRTAQEYFGWTQKDWFPNAELEITTTCATYLSFDAFSSGPCQTDNEFEERLRSHPLYQYAAQTWAHHAHNIPKLCPEVIGFLETKGNIEAASQAMIAFKEGWWHSDYSQVPRPGAGVHLAAYLGLEEALKNLLCRGCSPNLRDSCGRSPLSWAAARGQEAIVKFFLADTRVDVDSKDGLGRTALSYAAENGHNAVVQLLLAAHENDPDSRDDNGRTPLFWAVLNGHLAVVQQLLDTNSIDPERITWGQTPLSLAAELTHWAILKLLLSIDGMKPDFEDDCSRTPLSYAAEEGCQEVVQLLLAKGADPDSQDDSDRTPLSYAAESGSNVIVKLLLDTGCVNPESKDDNGGTPLFWAAMGGHTTVVRLLLATGSVDPDSKDPATMIAAANGHDMTVALLLESGGDPAYQDPQDWRTPLWWASRNGHTDVVRLLLQDRRVNPNAENKSGCPPLRLAVMNGFPEVVALLLSKDGIKVDFRDSEFGPTPLFWTADAEVAEMLLNADGVHPDSKDCLGRTPLSYAAANGGERIVRLLLARGGITMDSRDFEFERTPLSWAAKGGDATVCRLLLRENGVDINSGDKFSRTPLSLAAGEGHEAVVRCLLTTDGVDSDARDEHGQTPLSWAARRARETLVCIPLPAENDRMGTSNTYAGVPEFPVIEKGNEVVVELLLTIGGADPNSEDFEHGRTPLSWAAESGDEKVVGVLLKNGADVASKDKNGRTPLWWATHMKHEALVRVLLEHGAEVDGVEG